MVKADKPSSLGTTKLGRQVAFRRVRDALAHAATANQKARTYHDDQPTL